METDFKKKYEEALNLAKSYYGKGQNEFLDTLFPELRESDDERIRKHLIARLKPLDENDGIFDYLITKDKVLAYLERQKEQEPAEWSEEDENVFKYLHELISVGITEKFFDAQTAADMREWLNTRIKSLRSRPKSSDNWKPSEEQMMKGAVDAEIVNDIHNRLHVHSDVLPMPSEFKFGDKVKIIILRDDEN